MSARRCDFQGALGDFLTLDLGKVRAPCHWLGARRFWWAQQPGPFEVCQKGEQVRCGQYFDLTGPGRLAALGCRTNEPQVRAARVKGRQQYARRRRYPAVET